MVPAQSGPGSFALRRSRRDCPHAGGILCVNTIPRVCRCSSGLMEPVSKTVKVDARVGVGRAATAFARISCIYGQVGKVFRGCLSVEVVGVGDPTSRDRTESGPCPGRKQLVTNSSGGTCHVLGK